MNENRYLHEKVTAMNIKYIQRIKFTYKTVEAIRIKKINTTERKLSADCLPGKNNLNKKG